MPKPELSKHTTDMDDDLLRVIDAMPIAMVLSRVDGSLEYVNPALKQLLGYPDDEIYQPDVVISHPASMTINKTIRQHLKDDPYNPVIIEKQYLHKSGSIISGLLTMVAQADNKNNIKRFIAQIVDLTQLKQTQASLFLFKTLLDNSNDAIYVVDLQSKLFIECNQTACRQLGYSRDELINRMCVNDICLNPHNEKPLCEVINEIKPPAGVLLEREQVCKNGSTIPVEINACYIQQEEKQYLLAVVRDISHRKRNEAIIWRQANFDALTQLPNRRLLQDRLQLAIKQVHRSRQLIALLYLDLDRFKEVNDTLGHSTGDLLLIEAAKRLQLCIREVDTLARIGGDEFTIILTELDNRDIVERIANKLLTQLSYPFNLGNEQIHISTSIGISFYPQDAASAESLFKGADQAMYAAKKKGKNSFEYFTPWMQQQSRQRSGLIKELRQALGQQQFLLHYQPVFELTTGQLTKAEALLRWQHPAKGIIEPADFIALCEETGIIIPLGSWVFQQAIRQLSLWQPRLAPDFQLSINTSLLQFQDKQKDILLCLNNLKHYQLSTKQLIIEVTEKTLMDSHHNITEKLLALQQAGINVALDDFGTGYSALASLTRQDISFIKIDRSVIHNIAASSADRILCEAIIAMAHKLSIKVIAEGIETEAQKQLLLDAGCDYGQGYLFSPPIPAQSFQLLLKQH
ncbi:EAL and GGDEF domain-containing protein [Thalassomonas haliotis]|uniref:EAL domain-containing protein n=1 Tax=Thalassomonas haliotis TaxID=485448 RepID=A0ABY7V941_9GAMM|nr:EAL domain-containing protein [Thalassomonas haliotis]WDE10109.1 EAL domain-containing protein [Thalassomonas haliotis]